MASVKLVVIIIQLAIALTADGIVNQEDAELFERWKENYRRNFTSAVDEQKAKINLMKNLREVEIHNVRFKAGLETYSRGLWELSDLSFEEKSQVLAGTKINSSQQVLQGPTNKLPKGPSEVNWVKQGRVNPVLNQGRCGSCYAFATVGTLEGVALKKGIQTRFSVQQIVDCDKLNYGCDGKSKKMLSKNIFSTFISLSRRRCDASFSLCKNKQHRQRESISVHSSRRKMQPSSWRQQCQHS